MNIKDPQVLEMGTVPGALDTKSVSELWAADSKEMSVRMIN